MNPSTNHDASMNQKSAQFLSTQALSNHRVFPPLAHLIAVAARQTNHVPLINSLENLSRGVVPTGALTAQPSIRSVSDVQASQSMGLFHNGNQESSYEDIKQKYFATKKVLDKEVHSTKRLLQENDQLRDQINNMHNTCRNYEALRAEVDKMKSQGIFINSLIQDTTEKKQLEVQNDQLRKELHTIAAENQKLLEQVASMNLLALQKQSSNHNEILKDLNTLTEWKTQVLDTLEALIVDAGKKRPRDEDNEYVHSEASTSKRICISPEEMSEVPTTADIPCIKQHFISRVFTFSGFKKHIQGKPADTRVDVVIDVAPRGESKNYRKGILTSVWKEGGTQYVKCNVRSCGQTYRLSVASLEKMMKEWVIFVQ